MKSITAVLAVAALAGTASAQFTNGDFETGTFAGWTIANTPNGTASVQNVEMWDIDGPGPLGTNFAANFSVGNAVAPNQGPQGIELTPGMVLQGQAENGQVNNFTVVSFTDDEVRLDANHPLAGKALTFEIELLEIV